MFLRVRGKEVSGWYISAVGEASGPYDLIGYLDPTDTTPTIGWTVTWQNRQRRAPSVTVWCGQAQAINGDDQIDTTWLLTRSTSVAEDWEATMVSKDLFRRARASEADVRRAMQLKGVKTVRTITEDEYPREE
jgi:hypothetical protein